MANHVMTCSRTWVPSWGGLDKQLGFLFFGGFPLLQFFAMNDVFEVVLVSRSGSGV